LVIETMLPRDSLKGKISIITGGGSGIGKAIANELAALGSNIVIASRNIERLEKAAQEIKAIGVEVLTVQTDIRNANQVKNLIKQTLEYFGQIDILVNNAAGNFKVKSQDMSVNAWNSVINIVLNGTWYCSQEAGRHMIESGKGGSILNIGSAHIWTGNPLTVHSTSAKAGVLSLTKSLSREWAPYNIRVNMLAPGPIGGTDATKQLWATDEEQSKVLQSVPLGRLGNSKEVAELSSYLVSDYARYVTGACYVIDGGASIHKR
jgi:NAD(P)-dependent dehydrogenase (short-subunit alcohol dehydrogenase family)